ncbi:hypothetical protein ACFV98_35595 [Streptomyces violascens]|uniref:hypothetical protein n=1 Tax=Streptomyces violascens TaxID=67381 RepID=UPI0036560823
MIEQVTHAIAPAERLTGGATGSPLFGSIAMSGKVRGLRDWLERTGYREGWGLPVIPTGR